MATARYFGGAILGLLVGAAIVWGGGLLHATLWPVPPEVEAAGPGALRAYIAAAPGFSLLFVALVWSLAAAAAAFVGARIGAHDWAGGAPAGVLFIASGINLVLIPHPFWLHIVSAVLILGLAWIGTRFGLLALPRRA
jgi:hypothetical protein